MNRKPLLTRIALVTLLALTLTGCGKKQEQAQSTQPAQTTSQAVVSSEAGMSWSMNATTWSSPNGATVNLTLTPGDDSYEGVTFVVRLEGEDVASVPCERDGSNYVASADLNAADGYCYYALISADGTTSEIALNTPTKLTDETLVNMASALNSYCNVLVESSDFDGKNLTLTGGEVQVQLPRITNDGQTITPKEALMILTMDGEDVAQQTITLTSTDGSNRYGCALTDVSFPVPEIEEDHQLYLRLDVTLSNDQILSAPGGTWYYSGGELLLAVG